MCDEESDDARHAAAGRRQCDGDGTNGPGSGHAASAANRRGESTGPFLDDKRTILAAWASDFYALDSKPALRQLPGTPEPVSIDEVQSALRELDRRYGI
jgi:hypothetical protein